MTRLVYLDSCALQRPLDVLSTASMRVEAEGVDLILTAAALEKVGLVWSPALEYECIFRSPAHRARYAEVVRELSTVFQPATTDVANRARQLIAKSKLSDLDALHAACAEAPSATFVTADQRLLRRLRRAAILRIDVFDIIEAAAWIRNA